MKEAVIVPLDDKEFEELKVLGFDIKAINNWNEIYANTDRYIVNDTTAQKIKNHKAVIRIFEYKQTPKKTSRSKPVLSSTII